MTRQAKKAEELHSLQEYLRIAGIHLPDTDIADGERPDFILSLGGTTVGVEVTDFHVAGRRREVEEHWQRLRQWPMLLIDYPQYRSVELNFKTLLLPSKKDLHQFVGEVIALTSHTILSDERIPIDPTRQPVLAKYLTHIDLSPSTLRNLSWRWNFDIAWIGVSEDELLAIVEGKAGSTVTAASSYWLIVTEGPTLSRVMAFMDHEWVDTMPRLQLALNAGPYDRLILSQSPVIEWRRDAGWRTYRSDG
jgi:hypothetical protein